MERPVAEGGAVLVPFLAVELGRIMIRRYDRQDGGLSLPPSLFELGRTSRLQPALSYELIRPTDCFVWNWR
jgi:hypothetical protein